MSGLRVQLFGKLSVYIDDVEVKQIGAKVQELLCYLLLHRDRPHSRELLAAMLWGNTSTAQSKKYLRQALWQLQVALRCHAGGARSRVLIIEPEWVQVNSADALWLDVDVFGHALRRAEGEAGFDELAQAALLYRGDLLEGWYDDWCLAERDRLQRAYLGLLDKLMARCESEARFAAGVDYGALSLRYDNTRESTYRQLMRLHALAGDRAAALRQFERCVRMLDDELGIAPCAATTALHEQISGDNFPASRHDELPRAIQGTTLSELLPHLHDVEKLIGDLYTSVRSDIQRVERLLSQSLTSRREPLAKVSPINKTTIRGSVALRGKGR